MRRMFSENQLIKIIADYMTVHPFVQEQADWNESDNTSPAYIKNKPELFSGAYGDLTGAPFEYSEDIESWIFDGEALSILFDEIYDPELDKTIKEALDTKANSSDIPHLYIYKVSFTNANQDDFIDIKVLSNTSLNITDFAGVLDAVNNMDYGYNDSAEMCYINNKTSSSFEVYKCDGNNVDTYTVNNIDSISSSLIKQIF